MYLSAILLMCSAVCTQVFGMSAESMEMQTQFLKGIYEAAKDRQLMEGELNLLRNESAGFATAVRSFSEKGATSIINGNRAMTFDISMLRKQSQVLLQLAIKTQPLQYFQSVRHIYLYRRCDSCGDSLDVQPLLAQHTLLDEERASKWLELTINCDSCNWKELDEVHCVLKFTDDNDLPITFTEETAANFKSFLILFTHETLFPSENIQEALRKRRQTDEQTEQTEQDSGFSEFPPPPGLVNRTTLAEVKNRTTNCSRHEVLLTIEELDFRGTVIAPIRGAIQLTYCLGECSSELRLPTENGTEYDSRTRALVHNLNQLRETLHPPPCCIPNGLIPVELIVIGDEEVRLDTIPNVVDCKCQL